VCLKRKATPGNKTCRQCRAKMAAYDAKRRAERLAAKTEVADPPSATDRAKRPVDAPKPRPAAKGTRSASAAPRPPLAVTPAEAPRVPAPTQQAAPVGAAAPTARRATTAVAREFWETWSEEKSARNAEPLADRRPSAAPAVRAAAPPPVAPAPPAASRDPLAIAQDVMAQSGRRNAVRPSDDELLRMARELHQLRKRPPDASQLHVSDRAARQFADRIGIAEPEAARRQLAALLRNAHPTDKSPGVWRAREGKHGPDISVRVARDDESGTGLLVVVGIIGMRNVPAQRSR